MNTHTDIWAAALQRVALVAARHEARAEHDRAMRTVYYADRAERAKGNAGLPITLQVQAE